MSADCDLCSTPPFVPHGCTKKRLVECLSVRRPRSKNDDICLGFPMSDYLELGQPGFLRHSRGKAAPPPGQICSNERHETHVIEAPEADPELQQVRDWFTIRTDFSQLMGDAVEDAIYYVLDGARTHRFDLLDDRVDSDERRSVGTKLQFHVLENFDLPKLHHPDTEVDGIGLEIKGTIGRTWTIPKEGQCGVTLLIKADLHKWSHRAWLMRTHRAWLNDGRNNDGKRGIRARALSEYAYQLYPETSLRPNPLKLLSAEQLDLVFGTAGQETRLKYLFSYLPDVVIPRAVILTVCAGKLDPIRRARAIRQGMEASNIALLCGKWHAQSEMAKRFGHDLTGAAWVAVPWEMVSGSDSLSAEVRAQMRGYRA